MGVPREHKIEFLVETIYTKDSMKLPAEFAGLPVDKFTTAVRTLFVETCANQLSDDEVDALYYFYQNPVAIGLISKMPKLMKRSISRATELIEDME